MITQFNDFLNEEFDFFKKKNIAIMKAIKDNGLTLDTNNDEIYTTKSKMGYVFQIASGSDAFSVKVTHNGAFYKDELVTDLDGFISDILNGEKPTTDSASQLRNPTPPSVEEPTIEEPMSHTYSDLKRFYSTIEELKKKKQFTRKNNLTDTFFSEFIGKELLDSTIKNFVFDCDLGHDYHGLEIILENRTVITYTFQDGKDRINIIPDPKTINDMVEIKQTIPYDTVKKEMTKVTRKDARLLGRITKKINSDSNYFNGTKDLIVKEYESKKYKF